MLSHTKPTNIVDLHTNEQLYETPMKDILTATFYELSLFTISLVRNIKLKLFALI